MVIEHALITIRADEYQEFEVALTRAREVIARSPGFRSLRLSRGVETPERYLMLVEWDTLEDHTVGFRESPLFPEWRSHIGPFFDGPPAVDHFAPVAGLG